MNYALNSFPTHRILYIWPPSDYNLLVNLKRMLKGKLFGSNEKIADRDLANYLLRN